MLKSEVIKSRLVRRILTGHSCREVGVAECRLKVIQEPKSEGFEIPQNKPGLSPTAIPI